VRAFAHKLLWAVRVVARIGLLVTMALAVVFAAHVLLGVPQDLDRLPWLIGPRWLVAVGLALQVFVFIELVRVTGRR